MAPAGHIPSQPVQNTTQLFGFFTMGLFFYFFFFNFIALLHNMDNYKYSPPKPELVEVNLCSAIPQLVATINVSNNVQAMAECDNELPKIKLDITFLKRILVNQTTNAIQAMTDGGQSTRFPSLFRDLSTKLEAFKVARHQISRRVLRMNSDWKKSLESVLLRNEDGIGRSRALR
jgi:hypothetical protein